MNSKSIKAFVVSAFVFSATAIAQAQQGGSTAQSVDVGKFEYETHCAVCHGLGGKGDGPYVRLLRAGIVLPDLTELSRKNNGVFPFNQIVEIIDGRLPEARVHRPTDMPIWGERYKIESRNVNPDYNPEAFARAKILR
jgi:hypothetical protein